MSMRTDRRRFLQRVRRGRRAGGPGRPGLPVGAPAGLGRRGEAGPEGRAAPARDRAPGPAAGRHPARAAARGGRRADQEGAELSGGAGGAPAGRRAQRPAAAARRVQVPRGAGGQLGAPGQPGLARLRPLAADLLVLDHFKSSQAQDVKRGELDDGPGRREGRAAAGPGARGVHRGDGPLGRGGRRRRRSPGWPAPPASNEIYELFVRYGARDFRDIGHKAIYVANSWRTLHCIGWQHAEPVLRSLAYALLQHDRRQPGRPRRPGRPPRAAQPGPGRADQGRLVRGQARRRRPRPTCSRPCGPAPTTTPASRSSSS